MSTWVNAGTMALHRTDGSLLLPHQDELLAVRRAGSGVQVILRGPHAGEHVVTESLEEVSRQAEETLPARFVE